MDLEQLLLEHLGELGVDDLVNLYNQFAMETGDSEYIYEDLDEMFEGYNESPSWYINRWIYGKTNGYNPNNAYYFIFNGSGNIEAYGKRGIVEDHINYYFQEMASYYAELNENERPLSIQELIDEYQDDEE